MTKNKQLHPIISFFLISFFIVNLFQFVGFSHAQGSGFIIYSNFELYKYSEIIDAKENISSLNIEFPEGNWSMTDIEINFTNIKLEREVKIIEDEKWGENYVYYKNPQFKRLALGVQLEITEPTLLFGVYIKGYRSDTNETIQFQLRGYDEDNNKPNNTIYRTTELNISVNLEWYYQDFSVDPIKLKIGNYSLVMNGSGIVSTTSKYYWAINDISPKNPYLSTSEFIDDWRIGSINATFLYKLVQRTERIYDPEDICMSVEIDGDEYEICDDPVVGSGLLQIYNISHRLGEYVLQIPIKNNISVSLIFNINYSVKITNSFSSKGSIQIEENLDNVWTMLPVFSRNSNNYSVKFEYPKSWFYLTVYRKLGVGWENITSIIDIDIDKNTIIIPNNTILDGAEWKIEANSLNINFNLNFPNTEWEPGQELQFSIISPIRDGNLTFVLINPLEFEEYFGVKEVTTEETIFTYIIPSNAIGGLYTAKIYWNNETDAGIQTQQYEIVLPTVPFTMDPWMIFAIILITVGISVAGIISYRTIKTMRTKQAERKQKLYDSCIDILNLDYIIVTENIWFKCLYPKFHRESNRCFINIWIFTSNPFVWN